MLRRKNSNKIDYENLNEVIDISKRILKVTLYLIILALVVLCVHLGKEVKIFSFIINILKVATPFFIGIVIAWLLDPIVTWLGKKKVKRTIGSSFVFLVFIAVLYLFFRLLVPMLYSQINDFVGILPSLFTKFGNFIGSTFDSLAVSGLDLSSVEQSIYDSVEKIAVNLTTELPTTVIGFMTGLVSSIGTFLLGLVVGFYLLIDFDGVKHILDFFPKKWHYSINKVCGELNTTFKAFVQGTLLIALVVTILSWILFKAIGLPSPMLFGLIAGITNIIPYIGPWIGGALAAIVGFTVSPLVGVLTIVVVFLVQQVDNIVLHPIIMSKTVHLHPVTIMITLLIFGYFWGIIGMILSTPIVAGLKIILNAIDERYEILDRLRRDDDLEEDCD
jgi:predicted PurR-regulated permease PerM